MEFLNLILLGRRHLKKVIAFVGLVLLTTIYSAFLFTPPYKAILFTTVVPAVSSTSDFQYDGFYAVEASEKFTETVVGWGKNIDLLRRIEERSGIKIGKKISVSSQKKQNLLISALAQSEDEALKLAQVSQEIFREELSKYNQKGKRFEFVFSDIQVKFQKTVFLALILGGILLGFLLGVLAAYCAEFFQGLVSFDEEVEKIFKKNILLRVSRKNFSNDLEIIKSFAAKKKKVLLVGVGCNAKKIATKTKIDFIDFPKKAEKITDQTVIVCLSLGRARLDHLKSILSFTDQEIFPVLVE